MRRLLIALAIAHAGFACAQAGDATLRSEVNQLKARVEAIEKRLGTAPDAVAAQIPVAPAAMAPEGFGAKASPWVRIRQGLTRDEVKALLGEPSKAFELDGSLVWYYRYSEAAGSVFFDAAGRASTFQRPSTARGW